MASCAQGHHIYHCIIVHYARSFEWLHLNDEAQFRLYISKDYLTIPDPNTNNHKTM